MNITQGQEEFAQIVQKAWGDQQFKSDLVAKPVETIEKFTGKSFKVPENRNFVVVDQSNASTIYFNIPTDPSDVLLSEEQLEAIAGGAQPGDLSYDFGAGLHNLCDRVSAWWNSL